MTEPFFVLRQGAQPFTIGGRITNFIAIYAHQLIKLSLMFLPLSNIKVACDR